MDSGRSSFAELRDALERLGTEREPVTTDELTEELDCARRAATERLEELAERDDDVASKRVGEEGRVWWLTEGGEGRREAELGEVLGRVSDAFYALDEEYRFTHVNEQAEELLQHSEEELLGEELWEMFPEAAEEDDVWDSFHTAMETQEATSYELYFEPLDFRVEANVYPSETGVSVYFRDVTERVEREQALKESERRYRTLAEHFPNGAVALVDRDLRYQTVGGVPLDVADATVEEIEGSRVEDVLPPALAAELCPRYEAALDGESSSFETDLGDSVFEFRVVPVRNDGGDVFAALGMSQDITERKRREREVHRYKTIAETASDVIVTVDEGGTVRAVNPAVEDVFGYEPAELRGEQLTVLMPERLRERHRRGIQRYVETGERRLDWEYLELPGLHRDGAELPLAVSFSEYEYDGDRFFTGIIRDNSEQKAYERELESRARQQNAVAELGRSALEDRDLDALFEEASRLVADVLGNEYCKVLDLDPDAEELLLRQGVGWDEGVVGEATVSAVENASQASYTLRLEEPVVVEDFDSETRFSGPDFLTSHDVESGISTVIGSADDPWGILGTHDTEPKSFTDEDVAFVHSVANILAAAIERHESQSELQETVRQLQAANARLESFASMLAHELRNPVAIGQIYSQQLPDGADSEAVEYVTEAFDRIEDMIDVMLVLTRGRDAVEERESVDLARAARDVWDDVDSAGATLAVEVDRAIRADETYVRHLFRNLFENAVEHGGAGVHVTVGELPTGFYVADDGAGIPADERDAVFEAGYTTAGSRGGTGLGLAFVEELVEAYDWECTATESATGGARIEFTDVCEET